MLIAMKKHKASYQKNQAPVFRNDLNILRRMKMTVQIFLLPPAIPASDLLVEEHYKVMLYSLNICSKYR